MLLAVLTPLLALGQQLESTVRNLVANAKMATGTEVGIAVIDCQSGTPLVTIDARRAMIPASNLKLLTSGVALSVLGRDFEFKTQFIIDGTRLVIKGAGDPALGDPKLLAENNWDVPGFIGQIVAAAEKAGVRGITEIIVDDRVFDRIAINPGWPDKQLNLWYCAPVTGLNFHTNVLEIFPRNGDRIGDPPGVQSQPSAPWIQIDTSGARTSRDGSTSLWAQQTPSDAVFAFRLYGSMRVTSKAGQREPIEVTVADPGLMLARLLADALAAKGMLATPTVPVRLIHPTEDMGKGTPFAVVSTPIATVMRRCNVDSQNLYAECLSKRMAFEVTGQPGSWPNGATVVRGRLQEMLGPDIGSVQIADGSGLSRENQIPPLTLARFLAAMQRDPVLFDPFYESMADADEGRLEARFRDRKLQNELRAKTGFIRGVLCLSGYVRHERDGRILAFVVMVNNFGGDAGKARKLHEDVVEAIDRWLITQTPKPEPALGG